MYDCINPDDEYIELLTVMNDIGIAEMINGDAIKTAAESIGIKSDTVKDIFTRVLDTKYDKYIKSMEMLQALNEIKTSLSCEEYDDENTHSQQDIQHIRTYILKEKSLPPRVYRSPALDNLIDDLISDTKEEYEKCSIAINRVRDNIREGAG